VTLQSSNPADLPIINPNFLAHPFDKRLAIESVRETLDFLNQPLMSEDSIRFAAGPEGGGDEEILVRRMLWHMSTLFCYFTKCSGIGSRLTRVSPGLRPQNRNEHVARLRHRENGQDRRARHLRGQRLQSSRRAESKSGGHECCALSAEVSLTSSLRCWDELGRFAFGRMLMGYG